MNQPCEIYWESRRTRARCTSSTTAARRSRMALLRKGITDINTEDPSRSSTRGGTSSRSSTASATSRLDDIQYQTIPEGTSLGAPDVVGRHDRGRSGTCPREPPASALGVLECPQRRGGRSGTTASRSAHHEEAPSSRTTSSTTCSTTATATTTSSNFIGYQPPMNELDPDTPGRGRHRARRTWRTAIADATTDLGPELAAVTELTPAGPDGSGRTPGPSSRRVSDSDRLVARGAT